MTILLRFRATVWLGWVLTIISCGLLTMFSPTTSIGERIIVTILLGIGTGVLFPSLQFASQASQLDEYVAPATSTFVFIRSFGQTFGVAIGGVIFQNQWNKQMAKDIAENLIPPSFQISGKEAEGVVVLLNKLPPALLQTVRYLYSDSLRAIWIFFVPLAGVAFLASLFMKDYSLDKALNSNQAFDDSRHSAEESRV
jgi:hypothetical protein